MKASLKKGSIHFLLKGKKLKGSFYLIHLKRPVKNQWLFFKKADTPIKRLRQKKNKE
jgi:hypothetical protein